MAVCIRLRKISSSELWWCLYRPVLIVAGLVFMLLSGPIAPRAHSSAETQDSVEVEVLFKGRPDRLLLERSSHRSSDFVVRPWREDRFDPPFPAAESRVYRGVLTEHPEVSVLARLDAEGALAEALVVLQDGNADWMIRAGDGAALLTAPNLASDLQSTFRDQLQCNPRSQPRQQSRTEQSSHAKQTLQSFSQQDCSITQARLAFDVDHPFFLRYDGDIQAVVDRIEWLLLQVNTFYERDVLMTHQLTGIVVRTTQEEDLYGPETSLLDDLTRTWREASDQGDPNYPDFNFAHLMTARAAPGLAGLAWQGWSCSGKGFGWSVDDAATVGHELGHNWGASHCVDRVQAPWQHNIQCGGGGLWVGPANKARMIASKNRGSACLTQVPASDFPLPPYADVDRLTINLAGQDKNTDPSSLTIDVLANDHDTNCDPIHIESHPERSVQDALIESAAGAEDSAQSLVYHPPQGFAGIDRFSYTIQDSTGRSATSVVEIDLRHPGIRAYLPLDERRGKAVHDPSRVEAIGQLENMRFQDNSTQGKRGGALEFDDDDQYLNLNLRSFEAPWTLALWLRRDDSPNEGAVLMRGPGSAIKLEQWPNIKKLGITRFGEVDASFDYSAPIGDWVHLAFVGTEAETSLYVDGQLEDRLAVSIPAPSFGLSAEDDEAMRASIDDVQLYSYALSPPQVGALIGDRPAIAPRPADMSHRASSATKLSWSPNLSARQHDLFLGTDPALVRIADRSDPEYQGRLGMAVFTPTLEAGQRYFWRADAVFPDHSIQGDLWEFSTMEPLFADLQAYLPLDDDSLDHSAHFRGATPYGPPDRVAGQVGMAYDLIGKEKKWLRLDGSGDIPPPWTASIWVKPGLSTASASTLFGGANAIRLEQWNQTGKVGITQPGIADHIFDYKAPKGVWTNLLFMGHPSAVDLHVDGKHVDRLDNVSIPLPLRRIGNSGTESLNAIVDEIAVWKRHLSSLEVQRVHELGQGGQSLRPQSGPPNPTPSPIPSPSPNHSPSPGSTAGFPTDPFLYLPLLRSDRT